MTEHWVSLLVLVAAVAGVAYRTARARYRVRIPAALLEELVRHKVQCRHEPAARVTLELRLLLGAAPPASTAALLQPVSGPAAVAPSPAARVR